MLHLPRAGGRLSRQHQKMHIGLLSVGLHPRADMVGFNKATGLHAWTETPHKAEHPMLTTRIRLAISRLSRLYPSHSPSAARAVIR